MLICFSLTKASLSVVLAEMSKSCLQYVFGAIFRDIHVWSATGETGASGSGYHSLTAGNGGASGQALATLATPVGVVTDFYVGPDNQVG